jgi:hypothetical protein
VGAEPSVPEQAILHWCEKPDRHARKVFAILFRSSSRQPAFDKGESCISMNQSRTETSMNAIRRWVFCLLILLAAGIGASSLSSRESSTPQAQKGATAAREQSQIERGRYLVEEVGKCSECHTPRDANGDLDNSRYLQGAPIWIMPVHPKSTWAMRAPALAGFEGFTEDQGEKILEKGLGPNGLTIQPPMHIYHMHHEDAQAIIAYLRSLPSSYPLH